MLFSRTFHLSFSAKKNQAKKKPTAPQSVPTTAASQLAQETVETEPVPPTAASQLAQETVETEPVLPTAASHLAQETVKAEPTNFDDDCKAVILGTLYPCAS